MLDIAPTVNFFFGFIFGVVCTITYGYLKKSKFWRIVTGQDSMDADIENRANPTGEHEDEIMTVNQDAPHGPMAEEKVVLKNTNISRPGPHYVITTIDPYEDMIISSDREHEDEIMIVNEATPHGPMAEKRDVLKNTNISTSGPHYGTIIIDQYEDKIISDREHVDEINILNDDAPHGPIAENRDVIKNRNISTSGRHYVSICQNRM
ncbi:uncharacterized protein LOC143809835 [Ranitomeya variabilis]|uniref:uncharacterized protein LOC143809835 n=1 Tax=Ranitomeya variabilis TaxID=490064 RepID=UPI004055D507